MNLIEIINGVKLVRIKMVPRRDNVIIAGGLEDAQNILFLKELGTNQESTLQITMKQE
jgi:hypothetical protein